MSRTGRPKVKDASYLQVYILNSTIKKLDKITDNRSKFIQELLDAYINKALPKVEEKRIEEMKEEIKQNEAKQEIKRVEVDLD